MLNSRTGRYIQQHVVLIIVPSKVRLRSCTPLARPRRGVIRGVSPPDSERVVPPLHHYSVRQTQRAAQRPAKRADLGLPVLAGTRGCFLRRGHFGGRLPVHQVLAVKALDPSQTRRIRRDRRVRVKHVDDIRGGEQDRYGH